MGKEQTAQVFSQAAPIFDQSGPKFFSHSGRRLVELTQIASGARILDVAAGRGAVLFPAAERSGPAGRAIGVDLSSGMIRELASEVKGAGQRQISLSQMDAEQLAFAAGTFDDVVCGHALIFFPQALGEFYRVLKPGGKVCISIVAQGCFDWLMNVIDAYMNEPDQPEEDRSGPLLDVLSGLAEALWQAGFSDVQVLEEQDDLVYADEEAWWGMLWTLGVRGTLEAMEPSRLQALKVEIFRAIQAFKKPDGIHILFRVLFGSGVRPA